MIEDMSEPTPAVYYGTDVCESCDRLILPGTPACFYYDGIVTHAECSEL